MQALLENLVQMRTDAYKILKLHQRPDAVPTEDIGMWAFIMDAFGYLAVLTNVGIICFTTETLDGYTEVQKWLIFLVSPDYCTANHDAAPPGCSTVHCDDHQVAEQLIMAAKVAIQVMIPDEPDFVAEVKARNKFIVWKHVYGMDGDDASSGASPCCNIAPGAPFCSSSYSMGSAEQVARRRARASARSTSTRCRRRA
jgi:hypothetical protein